MNNKVMRMIESAHMSDIDNLQEQIYGIRLIFICKTCGTTSDIKVNRNWDGACLNCGKGTLILIGIRT